MYSNVFYFTIKPFYFVSFLMFHYALFNVPILSFVVLSFTAKLPYSQLVTQRKCSKDAYGEELQHGGRVRGGDHLPPHKYLRNTSTCGTTPTGHPLNAGRRPQTSQKARNSPHTWVAQKKKRKIRDKRIGMGPAPVGGSCEGGKV